MSSSQVAVLSRASTLGEKDLGEPEQAPGGRDGFLVLEWAPGLTILVLYTNVITEVELEFYLAIHS